MNYSQHDRHLRNNPLHLSNQTNSAALLTPTSSLLATAHLQTNFSSNHAFKVLAVHMASQVAQARYQVTVDRLAWASVHRRAILALHQARGSWVHLHLEHSAHQVRCLSAPQAGR